MSDSGRMRRIRVPATWTICVGLFVIQYLHYRHGLWGMADFWAHSAAVRELARHPLHPGHPLFHLQAADPYLSPYALMLGLFSRVTGVDAVTTLAWAGFINLAILLVALRCFCRSFFRRDDAFFWAVILFQFGWGRNSWGYSGFFRFGNLGYVAPYPSTFAFALSLFVAVLLLAQKGRTRPIILVAIALLSTVVVLSHPITGAFLFVLSAAVELDRLRRGERARHVAVVSFSVAASLLLAARWPYFSIVDLLLHNSQHFNNVNAPMYQEVLWRLGPALLGIPILVMRMKRNATDPLAASFLVLAALYGIGSFGFDTLGRMMSFIAFVLQMAIVGYLSETVLESWSAARAIAVGTAFLLLFGFDAFHYRHYIVALVAGNGTSPIQQYQLLKRVPADDVVLAPAEIAGPIPSFGGKIVSTDNTLAFVDDGVERMAAVRAFFAPQTSQVERSRIVCAYGVSWIVVPKVEPQASAVIAWLRDAAIPTTANAESLELYEAKRPDGCTH